MNNLIELRVEDFAKELATVKLTANATDFSELKKKWLGKDGILKQLLNELKSVPPEHKSAVAKNINILKSDAEAFFAELEDRLGSESPLNRLQSEGIDLSLPGEFLGVGHRHPITIVEKEILSLLRPFGFRAVFGPEIESEYYCFDALNIPKHHPARDMQDTFYTNAGNVLRTHTTSVQARELEKKESPLKIASFGRVFRNENEDATHQAMFHQFELVWLEKDLTLANLQGLIIHLLNSIYGADREVRFVPKFYPYTEPSIGVQIACNHCKGEGCPLCGRSGWVTVAGAGMIHENVLKEFGYDPESITGFAFGFGTGRLACQHAGLDDGRDLYQNDLRKFHARNFA